MTQRRRHSLFHVVALTLLGAGALGAQSPAKPAAPTPTAPAPTAAPVIYFQSPRNGAVVAPEFDVRFGLRNYGVAPAGVNLANTGHFHILINVESPAPGQVIPADSLHRHFGGGQIETRLALKPGRYTLRLVLADHAHKVIGPELISAPITVTVQKQP